MGAGHTHPLYRVDDSPVHRVPAEVKIVCLVLMVLAVVATPREMFWPYLIYTVLILIVWRLARIPLRWVLPRMMIEVPFVFLAVLLPFAEGGQQLSLAGMHLSVAGLWAAWGIVVKGTLGVAASLTFAATTSARPPANRTCCARACTCASCRATSTTSTPCATSASAVAAPMALPAPVTTAAFPARSWGPLPVARGSRRPPGVGAPGAERVAESRSSAPSSR